jgi:hypothetical protein
VTTTGLAPLLQELYRERMALYLRHVKGAEPVSDYEFNNTYQYVIAREETHLGWIRSALTELGAEVPASFPSIDVPGTGTGAARQRAIFEEDARNAQAFVDRWRPRLEGMVNKRHEGMLRVILGETLEHKRFFEQALAGRLDLLGRRPASASTGGGVLPTRWVE